MWLSQLTVTLSRCTRNWRYQVLNEELERVCQGRSIRDFETSAGGMSSVHSMEKQEHLDPKEIHNPRKSTVPSLKARKPLVGDWENNNHPQYKLYSYYIYILIQSSNSLFCVLPLRTKAPRLAPVESIPSAPNLSQALTAKLFKGSIVLEVQSHAA